MNKADALHAELLLDTARAMLRERRLEALAALADKAPYPFDFAHGEVSGVPVLVECLHDGTWLFSVAGEKVRVFRAVELIAQKADAS